MNLGLGAQDHSLPAPVASVCGAKPARTCADPVFCDEWRTTGVGFVDVGRQLSSQFSRGKPYGAEVSLGRLPAHGHVLLLTGLLYHTSAVLFQFPI